MVFTIFGARRQGFKVLGVEGGNLEAFFRELFTRISPFISIKFNLYISCNFSPVFIVLKMGIMK